MEAKERRAGHGGVVEISTITTPRNSDSFQKEKLGGGGICGIGVDLSLDVR